MVLISMKDGLVDAARRPKVLLMLRRRAGLERTRENMILRDFSDIDGWFWVDIER